MKEQWYSICPVAEIKNNLGVCALVGNTQIALFRMDNSIFAIDNFDPFSQANVISRGIVGDLQGKLVVASPIYKQHFDLETGQCLEEPSIYIKTYPVRIVKEQIEIREQPAVLKVA